MKFMISSEAVEKALQTVSSVFSGSDLEKKKVANNLERAANAFLHENEEKFKSTKDLENYAADLRQRSCSYTDALETFLDDGMWESLFWCKGERVDLLESLKKVAGQKIKVIVGDLLMEVFVRNEVKNFDEVAKSVLRKRNWKAFAGQHALSVTVPEMRPKVVEMLHLLLRGLEAQFAAFEKLEDQKPYLDSLLCLLGHMRKVVEEILESMDNVSSEEKASHVLQTETPSEKVSGDRYPAWIFKSPEAFQKFTFIHNEFCTSCSDLAFLYREFFEEGLIVVGIRRFQDWYNRWNHAVCECWTQFKTWNRLAVKSRVERYRLVTQMYMETA